MTSEVISARNTLKNTTGLKKTLDLNWLLTPNPTELGAKKSVTMDCSAGYNDEHGTPLLFLALVSFLADSHDISCLIFKPPNASWSALLHQVSARGSRRISGRTPCKAPQCAQLRASTSHWPNLTSWLWADGGRACREADLSHSRQTRMKVVQAVRLHTALATFVLYKRP